MSLIADMARAARLALPTLAAAPTAQKALAIRTAADAIRVNSIHPGYIWTPMVEQHLRDSGATDLAAARAQVGSVHPLGHVGEPDDIAWGAVFLASDESRFMTGSELVIDGGYTAR